MVTRYANSHPDRETESGMFVRFADYDAQAKHIGELEEALEKIRDLKHCKDCPPVPGHDLAPGGHTCSCPQKWARAALAKLEKNYMDTR